MTNQLAIVTSQSESGCELVRVRPRWRRAAGVAAALAVFMTGCSGSGGDDEAATTTTFESLFETPRDTLPSRQIAEGTAACGLLTRAEVESAVGAPVNAGKGIEREGSGSSCSWSLRSDGSQNVSLAATPGNAASFDRVLSSRGGAQQRLTGVGDGAIVAEGSAVGFKGSTLVLIAINTSQTEARKRASAEALVRAAVPRI